MAKILGIGNVVLDTILETPHYPSENEELRANSRHYEVGGNVCNSLYVLSQLGHESSIVTTVASDAASKQLVKGIQQRNIATDHVQKHVQGSTPTSYVIQNAENGSRTITHFRDLPELSFDFFAKIEIEDYDWLHFEGRNMEHLPGMLNIAKTFLDDQPMSLEVEKPRKGIEALFDSANLLIFSHHYAKARGYFDGAGLLKFLKQKHPDTMMVCTWGEQGAWFTSANQEIKHQAAEELPEVVDTLGAGDTFNAALIHALINEHTLGDAVSIASKLAARKCQQQGLDDLTQALKQKLPLSNISKLNNSKTLVVKTDELPHDVVLIKYEDQVKAYMNNCPHQDVPLNEAYKIDVNPFEKTMKCSVHDAFFSIENGECIEGPCMYDSLESIDVMVDENGDIFLKN